MPDIDKAIEYIDNLMIAFRIPSNPKASIRLNSDEIRECARQISVIRKALYQAKDELEKGES